MCSIALEAELNDSILTELRAMAVTAKEEAARVCANTCPGNPGVAA